MSNICTLSVDESVGDSLQSEYARLRAERLVKAFDLTDSPVRADGLTDKQRTDNELWVSDNPYWRIRHGREIAVRRAIQRCFAGMNQGGRYQLVTLTTPEGYQGDCHRAWRKLVERMHRRGMPREYYVVKEYNKRGTCWHLHVLVRLDWISFTEMRRQWKLALGVDSVKTLWTYHAKVKTVDGIVRYLAKYLTKEQFDAARCKHRYWASHGWTCRRWFKFSFTLYKMGYKADEALLAWLRGAKPAVRGVLMGDLLLRLWWWTPRTVTQTRSISRLNRLLESQWDGIFGKGVRICAVG